MKDEKRKGQRFKRAEVQRGRGGKKQKDEG